MGKIMINGNIFGSDISEAKDIIFDNIDSVLTSTNVQDAINELNSKIGGEEMRELYYGSITERETLANLITSKGVQTNVSDSLLVMADNISKIFTGSGNALPEDVKIGKTFTNDDGIEYTGTMPNNGAVSPSALNAGENYTIPAGYHNGSGKVTTNSLASQTLGTATADDIVEGKTAWVNGIKITGINLVPELSLRVPLVGAQNSWFSAPTNALIFNNNNNNNNNNNILKYKTLSYVYNGNIGFKIIGDNTTIASRAANSGAYQTQSGTLDISSYSQIIIQQLQVGVTDGELKLTFSQ